MSENIRETKQLTIGEHIVVVHTYVTGREMRNIEAAMMDKLEVSQKESGQEITGFKGSMLTDRQDMQIKAVVVSIDGKTEDTIAGKTRNIIDLVLDLVNSESEQILEYVRELTEPKKEDAGN